MGQQQSKDELVYQQVIEGNTEGVKSLCREGAGLEWIDKDGKTPLIVACMDSRLYIVAKTLIQLGANINAYRPGRHAGTPLHHAAKRGLHQTVKLLLSHGANAFLRNDDCQTPLEVARAKGFNNVVRTIEAHISYFSGHIREIFGPGFLEALAPQLLSRKIWAVVVPGGPQDPSRPPKLELVLYSTQQDAQPRAVVSLWRSKIEQPIYSNSDPVLTIYDLSSKARYKFASAIGGDKQQLRMLHNACTGISQAVPLLPTNAGPSSTSDEMTTEAAELAAAINASIQSAEGHNLSAAVSGPQFHPNDSIQGNSSSNGTNDWVDTAINASNNDWVSMAEPPREGYNGWAMPEEARSHATTVTPALQETSDVAPPISASPSAPPLPDDTSLDGPIHYPDVDLSPVDICAEAYDYEASKTGTAKEDPDSLCVICWEAPVEGACVPCGHMAGCMACLKEIKAKKGDCPVCRAKIDQIIKIFAV